MNASAVGLRELEPVRLSGDHFDRTDPVIQGARRRLKAKVSSAAGGTVVAVDLARARLSASCLGELLGDVLESIVAGACSGRHVRVLDRENDGHAFELDAALGKESRDRVEKLICVRRALHGQPSLAGPVDQQVERTYRFVLEHWSLPDGATARALSEADGISIQAAGNRLAKAAQLGVIHAVERVPVSGGGSQWLYVPID